MVIDERLVRVTEDFSHRLLFVTISGAHLYGFPSADSDFDLRGVHVLPLDTVVGLDKPQETITIDQQVDGIHLDLVTHDIKPYFLRLLNRNGNLLDQIFSPLVVHTTPEHDELKEIAKTCVTHKHSHHYGGLAQAQWKLFLAEEKHRIKPLLYVYRSLLSGINLMRTGKVESNLADLNEVFEFPHIADLIARKTEGEEQTTLEQHEVAFHEGEYHRLQKALDSASQKSSLPELPPDEARSALNDLLLKLRYVS
jgi:predicted nucleotidyltransferase